MTGAAPAALKITLLDQLLGDLDRVEGGAIAQVVVDHPHLEAVEHRRVLAQARDEDRIFADAFDGRDDGVITVRVEIDGPDYLVVEIADTGFGITTIARDPGAGFGLPIIGALADSVEIKSGHEGTRLVLRFPRAG